MYAGGIAYILIFSWLSLITLKFIPNGMFAIRYITAMIPLIHLLFTQLVTLTRNTLRMVIKGKVNMCVYVYSTFTYIFT